jgi:hypothetical protein
MRTLLLPIVVVAAAALVRDEESSARDATLRNATRDFLAALRPESRERASFVFEDEKRLDWHFVPRARTGLPLGAMDDAERRAAHRLLRTALTPAGYGRAAGVIELESVLRAIERNPGRDPGLYFFSVFGDPGGSGPWSLRFEGHHLALNFTGDAAEGIAPTPLFFGANPAEVRGGERAGFKLLAPHEESARRLVRALGAEQRGKAVIAATAPADVLFGPGRAVQPSTDGLPLSELTSEQKPLAEQLLAEVLSDVACGAIDPRAQLAEARFAWAGGLEPGEGHYWRIVAPAGVVEYDNTQDGANHVHFLWRDPANDFAAGWLARHHAQDHAAPSKE